MSNGQQQATLLVPLSSVDQAGVENTGSIYAYVVSGPFDADALRTAALRAADKWRLLAGKVEWDAGRWTYAIRVPLGAIEPDVRFTRDTSQREKPLGVEVSQSGDNEARILRRPGLACFRHGGTQGSLAMHAKTSQPILSIHVCEFADATCIGVTLPHGVFDGTGAGMVIKALDAELNGRTWTPPPFGTENIMEDALRDISSYPSHDSDDSAELPQLAHFKREFNPVGVSSLASLVYGVGYEYLWHRAEDRALFLGRDVVERIVSRTQEGIRPLPPTENVTTGDILLMWFIQAAYGGDEDDDEHTISIASAVSLRTTLTKMNQDFATYPHNASIPTVLPLLTTTQLKRSSIGELALAHRAAINALRTLPYVQAWSQYIAEIGRPVVPARRRTSDAWLFSNQVLGAPTDISFGPRVDLRAFYFLLAPFLPDHSVVINKINGGYVMQGYVRRARWNAIERVLQELTR
ncbi:hypothetical protein AURDEDRAFT_135268 [Auricularia subglabra TFB-10046 SS5]|nr:hypothetical protein AURDEDRAFT_135268 [Auricularia subglabra TFB-10046 SS5]